MGIAKSRNYPYIVNLLRGLEKFSTPLHYATMLGFTKKVQELIQTGANVNAQNE